MPLLVDGLTGPVQATGAAPNDPVLLGDIPFGQVDEFGVQWILEKFGGWTDAAPSTGQSQQRAAAHGVTIGNAYYGPRVLTLEGYAVAGSWEGAEAAADRLKAAIPLSTLTPLYVGTSTPRQVMVRQEGQPLVTVADYSARFSISLLAPDPFRYSVDEVSFELRLPSDEGGVTLPRTLPHTIDATFSTGRLSANNDGTAEAKWTGRVDGPAVNPRLVNFTTGQELRLALTLGPGRFVELDSYTRRVLLDGVSSRRGKVSGQWWQLAPGPNLIGWFSETTDLAARFTVTYRHAWL